MAAGVKDYYETLGVPRTATQKEVRAAFRRLARKHHPDVNPGDKAAEDRFKEINEAHEVLADPEKRKKYDELGANWREYEAWERAGRPGRSPFGQSQVEYRTVSPEDLEDLFGDTEPFSDFFHDVFGRTSGGRRARRRAGHDVEGEVEISLEEAYRGTTRTAEVPTAGGVRRIEVRIPAGVADGTRVRAPGQGAPGQGGAPAGHLFVRVRVRPDPRFRREGDTLHVRVPVPLDIAVLGGSVAVPTPRGTTVELTVPAGTQNGARLRLRGLGMPRLRGEGSGDLIAEIDARLPEAPSAEVRELAAALRREREAGGGA